MGLSSSKVPVSWKTEQNKGWVTLDLFSRHGCWTRSEDTEEFPGGAKSQALTQTHRVRAFLTRPQATCVRICSGSADPVYNSHSHLLSCPGKALDCPLPTAPQF